MSRDGSTLAVGAPFADGDEFALDMKGAVKLFALDVSIPVGQTGQMDTYD